MAPLNSERVIHHRERLTVALTYVLSCIPLFGILIACIVVLSYKEKSRTIVFHAKQAVVGQAFFLLVFVVVVLFSLFAYLVGVLNEALRDRLLVFDEIVLYVTYFTYVVGCFYYAWMALDGYDVDLPMVGERLRGKAE